MQRSSGSGHCLGLRSLNVCYLVIEEIAKILAPKNNLLPTEPHLHRQRIGNAQLHNVFARKGSTCRYLRWCQFVTLRKCFVERL